MLEARFRMSWYIVEAGDNELVLSGKTSHRTLLPPGYYESILQLCKALNDLFKGKGVVFTPIPITLQVQITLLVGQFLEGPVLQLLGFDSKVENDVGGSFTSPKMADVLWDHSSLFVYCSIVANSP